MPQTANVLKIIGLGVLSLFLSIMFFSMAHGAIVFIGLWIAVALYAGVKRWLSGLNLLRLLWHLCVCCYQRPLFYQYRRYSRSFEK